MTSPVFLLRCPSFERLPPLVNKSSSMQLMRRSTQPPLSPEASREVHYREGKKGQEVSGYQLYGEKEDIFK